MKTPKSATLEHCLDWKEKKKFSNTLFWSVDNAPGSKRKNGGRRGFPVGKGGGRSKKKASQKVAAEEKNFSFFPIL